MLPGELNGTAFLTTDSRIAGVSRGRLRSADLARPFRGVRAIGLPQDDLLGRCIAFEARMSAQEFFSHETAAALYGMPLPASGGPLHVCVRSGQQPPRVRGVISHEDGSQGLEIWLVQALAVASPADTWCQLANSLSKEDVTAVGDFLISGRRLGAEREPPLTSMAILSSAIWRRGGARGIRKLRWALPRLRTGVDSRPETLLRLLLVAAGFPEPLIGDPTAVDGGSAVLHPDLKYAQWRVVFEYEGDGHRTDKRRFRADIARRERFEAAGWRVIRVTADDLFVAPEAFLRRVRAIIQAREGIANL